MFLSPLLCKSVNLPASIISVLSSHAVCMCVYLVCIGGIRATVSANFLYTGKICSWTDGKRRAVKQTRSQQIHGSDFVLFSFKSTADQPPDGEASASTFFPQLSLTMWWCSRATSTALKCFPVKYSTLISTSKITA